MVRVADDAGDKSVAYHYNRKKGKDLVSHFKRRKVPVASTALVRSRNQVNIRIVKLIV